MAMARVFQSCNSFIKVCYGHKLPNCGQDVCKPCNKYSAYVTVMACSHSCNWKVELSRSARSAEHFPVRDAHSNWVGQQNPSRPTQTHCSKPTSLYASLESRRAAAAAATYSIRNTLAKPPLRVTKCPVSTGPRAAPQLTMPSMMGGSVANALSPPEPGTPDFTV